MANRLIHETSPYLLQHAENPVDWYPWGDEAFAEARRRNVPILLSIGYSACHWCHVMAHESFENETIAAQMNAQFVNVKVDREERPDVDELYMRAVQAFNRGQGGWPMTVFLTHDGKPFFGGTYFPPTARGGATSFPDVLTQGSRSFAEQPDEVGRVSDEAVDVLRRTGHLPAAARALTGDWLDPIAADADTEADPLNGGFGGAPKFPPHGTLALLLAHHHRTGRARSLEIVTHALDGMAKGGLYDAVAGGFCRYSVDAEWRVPHFEKMLYDTAQLVPVYVDAYKVTGDPHYARIVRESLTWMCREMSLSEGGFASSLDADSEGHEGTFYVFTPEEIRDVVPANATRVAELLQITAIGSFEHGASVVRLETPLERLAAADRALLERALPLLFEAREQRAHPERDTKVVVAWNGLAISALARAAVAFDVSEWRDKAIAAAEFVLDRCVSQGRLQRTFMDGRAHIAAFADDYANLVAAFLDLWEATFDPRWLERATHWSDELVRLFWDAARGGFFLVGSDQPELVARSHAPVGGAEPGANGTAALAFVRLGRLLGRADLEAIADRIARAAQSWLSQAPRLLGAEALAGAWLSEGGLEVAIAGDPSRADTAGLLAEVRRHYLPLTVVALVTPSTRPLLPWTEGKTEIAGAATVWVCEGHTCQLPTADPADVGRQLDGRSRRGVGPRTALAGRVRAPELPSEAEAWLGTDVAFTLERLRGNVVVLDFWTYCCINCLHVLPELAALEEAFAVEPMVVIGVHCAKFPTEEIARNVEQAMARHGVRHPVLHDPVHAIWEEYTVRSWPTIVVIDSQGRIALQQSGEISHEDLARTVRALLAEGRAAGTLSAPIPYRRARPAPAPEPVGTVSLRYPGKVHVFPDAFEQEMGLDVYAHGRLYVSDTANHRILECLLTKGADGWPRAKLSRTFGDGQPGLVDGGAASARFRGPQGVRRYEQTLYVADTENHALRAIDLLTGVVRTLAGNGTKGQGTPSRDQLREPLATGLRSPWDVEIMPNRRAHLVFIAMAGSHQIWVYGAGHLGLHAGSGREDHIDGPSSQAALAQPSGLSMLGRYLLFADSETSSVRAVDLQSHQVVTVVGRGLFDFGDSDGKGDAVRMQHPLGLTFVGDRVLVADTFNHKIKAIGLQSGETKTLVGGDPSVLCEPGGVSRIGVHLVVADTNNHRLRAVHNQSGEIRDLRIE